MYCHSKLILFLFLIYFSSVKYDKVIKRQTVINPFKQSLMSLITKLTFLENLIRKCRKTIYVIKQNQSAYFQLTMYQGSILQLCTYNKYKAVPCLVVSYMCTAKHGNIRTCMHLHICLLTSINSPRYV